jgi:hypothetical protein
VLPLLGRIGKCVVRKGHARVSLKAGRCFLQQNHIPQIPIPGLKARDFAEGIKKTKAL